MSFRAHSRKRSAPTLRALHLTCAVIVGAVVTSFMSPTEAMTTTSPPISIDGSLTRVVALERDGTVFVPVRGVFEKLGATVDYAPPRSIVARKGSSDLARLTLGSRRAEVNGSTTTQSVAPFSSHGRVMVPLRLISVAAGATVAYRANPRAVEITHSAQVAAAPVQVAQAAPAADATTAPADTQSRSQGISWWVWLLGALVLLGLILFFVRRKKEPIITTSRTRKAGEPKITTRH